MHRAANAYCAIYLVLLYYHRHRGICTVGAIDLNSKTGSIDAITAATGEQAALLNKAVAQVYIQTYIHIISNYCENAIPP